MSDLALIFPSFNYMTFPSAEKVNNYLYLSRLMAVHTRSKENL